MTAAPPPKASQGQVASGQQAGNAPSVKKGMRRPAQTKVPLVRVMRELPGLVRAGPTGVADLALALAELAVARVLLACKTERQLGIPDVSPAGGAALTGGNEQDVARVSKAIAIVAPRVPWRSDCLVQCLAGRRWLARRGVKATITIGVRNELAADGSAALLAHAWLTAGDIIVTGGDISGFEAFSTQRKPPRPL